MNAKHKRWKCPTCNKRAFYLVIDSYFLKILELMKKVKEKDRTASEKIELDN
jgi:hypothetical protein